MNAIGGYNWFVFIYCTLFLNINLFSLTLDISSLNEMDKHSFIMCPRGNHVGRDNFTFLKLSFTLISLIWSKS